MPHAAVKSLSITVGFTSPTTASTGKPGRWASETHVRVATGAELHEMDNAPELQKTSIWLQTGLAGALQEIAKHHGIR